MARIPGQYGLAGLQVVAAINRDRFAQGNHRMTYQTKIPGIASTISPSSGAPSSASAAPTKLDAVLTLLRRDEGATVLELAAVTGWQPHTTRAAISGLKRKGHHLEKTQRDRVACYHLTGGVAAFAASQSGSPGRPGGFDGMIRQERADPPVGPLPAAGGPPANAEAASALRIWPRLVELGADDQTLARRHQVIGGSDANTILSGSPERIHRLWLEKRGEAQPEDLSGKLPVMLGCWTEAFNRQWYERATGRVISRVGEWVRCSTHEWRACTLDGFLVDTGTVWEAKHSSSFAKGDELLERYMPQLQHNMAVTGAATALLSVIFGNGKWECFEVAADWLYQQDLLEAEIRFWSCVVSGKPPVPAAVPPPPKAIGVREICLEGNNLWASSAAEWLMHGEAAKRHAAAVATLKDMIEPDVARAFGHGIEAKRSKAGAITIRALKS